MYGYSLEYKPYEPLNSTLSLLQGKEYFSDVGFVFKFTFEELNFVWI